MLLLVVVVVVVVVGAFASPDTCVCRQQQQLLFFVCSAQLPTPPLLSSSRVGLGLIRCVEPSVLPCVDRPLVVCCFDSIGVLPRFLIGVPKNTQYGTSSK